MTNRDFALIGFSCQEGRHADCLTLSCCCHCHSAGDELGLGIALAFILGAALLLVIGALP